jgi:hypothetical protein
LEILIDFQHISNGQPSRVLPEKGLVNSFGLSCKRPESREDMQRFVDTKIGRIDLTLMCVKTDLKTLKLIIHIFNVLANRVDLLDRYNSLHAFRSAFNHM